MARPKLSEVLGPRRDVAHPPLERLLEVIPNRYILVNVIARRARDLQNGATALVECDREKDLPIDIAIAELLSGRITYVPPEKTYRELRDTGNATYQEMRLDEG